MRLQAMSRSVRTVQAARGVRWASTHAPAIAASTPPAPKLPPGEELDPQLDGYPQLPWRPFQHRQPRGWDDLQERRNFNELVHEQEDILGMWGPDWHKISGWKALSQILLMLSCMGAFAALVAYNAPECPAVRREYPYDGLRQELGGLDQANPETNDEDEE